MVFQKKVDFGGSKCTSKTLLLVNQIASDFFRRTPEELLSTHHFPILDISIRSGDIRDRSLKLSEVDHNFARFWPYFLGEGPPKFWNLDYKIKHTSDHVAKFDVDRPRELGDLAVKKREKKHLQ